MSDSLFSPVSGFRFGAIEAGIKKKGGLDLALIVAHEPATAAGVFTKSRAAAAPVLVAKDRARNGLLQAVLVNSGNANACTGKDGLRAARQTTSAVADALGIAAELVAPASTGVIGVPLPVETILGATDALVASLDPDGAQSFANAILTTDRSHKAARTTFRHRGGECTVLAIAKGAGMIHPDMATTLAFVITDAPVKRRFLKQVLREVTDSTFNCISVDGDTSTNDAIVALASGAAGGERIDEGKGSARRFRKALHAVLEDVALQIVADGEGAERVARIDVVGARNDSDARRIAAAIATSPLVKTALHGRDPNWGRIVAAAGRAGVAFDPDRVEVRIGDVLVYRAGRTQLDADTERRAADSLSRARCSIHVRLRAGSGAAHYWTCDLGHRYVDINADYRS